MQATWKKTQRATNAKCLAHEDNQFLTWLHFRDCKGHDARQQPRHVEPPQFHFLDVLAGDTPSVKFVLKLFGVERSPSGHNLSDVACNHCKHDCSQSPLSQQQTSYRRPVQDADDLMMMTFQVLVMTGVVRSNVFFLWSLVNIFLAQGI